MTSSMLSGERRWASARRSGMTVLGKVAVPKPINLPSQRLENHGLDPNVEIVPKGTLSWGSKSSSSSHAWGSSTPSPNADGGGGSPSHLCARPSSGGSGTRPSTAGSDRAQEPANAWGSNSRPSSASGAITSNQTSFASLRPRSAETRPGSSHLSRFAESVSESSGAWSAAGTAEKLGISSSKNEGFSLTSGDFPTLGSEKDTTRKNTEEDHSSHGRPGSSSGEVAAMKERIDTPVVGDISVSENVRGGTSSSWRRDNPPCPEDGVHPSVEKWHADPQGPHPFPNAGIHPQHYDAWHGPPINNHPGPGGVWYRGPTGGQPYGSPVPSGPGCFPLEPFPYYRPQIPGTALANPQPVPPPGAGPRGHHPKNGDMYRPPMPDAYVRPAMPIRPGFYPPPVAYEGYYGPPMGYCNPSNPSERDIRFMGMAAGPAPYNMFRGPNAPNISNAHARGSGYGHSGKALGSEHVESGHSHDTRRPYKVLLKQHDALDGKDERKWEDNIPTSVEKDCQQKASSWENDWQAEHRDEEMNLRGTVSEEAPPHSVDQCSGGSVSMKVKSPETTENAKTYINISAKGMEHPASSPEVSAASKDSSLIKKIEGLNAKARASDGQYDATYVSNKEEQKSKSHVNVKPIHSLNEGVTGSGAVYPDRMHGPAVSNSASNEIGTSVVDRRLDSTAASGAVIPRRSSHGVRGRTDHRDRGRFNSQEIDGWQKKPTAGLENSKFNVQDHSSGAAETEKSGYPKVRDEGEPVQTIHDPRDSQAGRAMMMELAKQRAKQRQKEEEERERDQKAKALAKLEELNKRTQAVESSAQRLGADSCSAIQNKQEGSAPSSKFETSSLAVVSNPNVILDVDESITQVEKSTVLSNELPPESTKAANGETTEEHAQSLTLLQGANAADAPCNNAPEVTNSSAPKQKRVSSRLKHNVPLQKSSTEISVSANTIEVQKGQPDTAVDVASSTEVVANEIASNTILNSAQNIMTESSMQQRRKSGRNSRTKHKVEEASSMAALPSGMSEETNIANNSVEGKAKSSDSLIFNSVQSLSESKEANQSSERKSSSPNEEFHGKVNNQWKTQHSRRAARNPQSHWAPVRSHNRSEATEEVNQKMDVDAGSSPAKSDPQSQNNPKNKRAEIERYVPKPAAKETAQQGSSQQHVATLDNQTRVDETVRRTDSGQGAATTTELRSGDGRQYRQGKGHGSWRQRASAESSMHNMQDGQPSNPNNNTHKSTLYQQNQKIDAGLLKEQSNHDEWNSDDGWNIPDPPDSAIPPSVPVTRDQGVAAQGKRHVTKGHRGIGKSHESDHKKLTVGEAEHNTLSPLTDTSQTDFPVTSKENRGGDRTLSWQPKSSTSNQRGNRPDGGQNVGAENGKGNKKDSNSRGRVHPPPHQPQKQTSEGMAQPQPFSDLSVPEKGNVEGTVEMGHQDTKGERRTGSAKGRPCSPNHGAGILMEPPPSNVETQLEQRTLGLHRNGNQNNRFCREQESHGDWSSSGQEHNLPAKRDRLRHNSHYEYQPVGPQNNNRANNPEGPKDGSHNTGGRFRERGHGHSRHGGGNFHGRKSGNNRVDGGYD